MKSKLIKIGTYIINDKLVRIVWYTAPLFAALLKSFNKANYNNYLIYKNVFIHTVLKTNLYGLYPLEFFDKNHYGIIFSLIMAPFYYLPDSISILLYQGIQLFLLEYVVIQLPLSKSKKTILLLLLLVEAITNAQNVQINTFIAFVIAGSYVFLIKRKEFTAAFLTMLGFFIKLYGIVALGLFFFVKNKLKYFLSIIISAIVLFFMPLLITDFDFIKQSYLDWYIELSYKTSSNSSVSNVHQNISALGMATKIFSLPPSKYLYMILSGCIIQLTPYFMIHKFKIERFQLLLLSSLLLFVILFSTGTEASGHIIGALGVGIWWLSSENYRSKKMIIFIIFVFLLGSLSITDLTPAYLRAKFIRPYNLKALPYMIVWLICIYETCFRNFKSEKHIL